MRSPPKHVPLIIPHDINHEDQFNATTATDASTMAVSQTKQGTAATGSSKNTPPTTSTPGFQTGGAAASSSTAMQSLRHGLSFFQRHDSTFSVTDQYHYQSSNDLNVWNGAALLCADCLGTGLLALPHDITVVLGSTFGLFFLVLQLPINLYAGTILSDAALYVETKQAAVDSDNVEDDNNETQGLLSKKHPATRDNIIIQSHNNDEAKNYQAVSIDVDVELIDDNSIVDEEEDNKGNNRNEEHFHRT